MVFLRHLLLGPTERLDVWAALDADGSSLILEYPGGKRCVHRYSDDAALSQGTARVQAELLRDGWEPQDALDRPAALEDSAGTGG